MTAAQVGYMHPDIAWNGLTVTDLFCGAGGSSSGLVAAGFKVVIAANHWAKAIESHQINHPETDHSDADISQVQPAYFPRTDVLWASPECTSHSVAKGVKRQRADNETLFELDGTRPLPDDAANRSRATMWDVPRFAEHHRYKVVIIENVVDAYRWLPFPAWLMAMESLGYEHQLVWLNSMHAQAGGLPAPQSRDRMYVVFWLKTSGSKPNLKKWTSPKATCLVHGVVTSVQSFKKAEQWGRYRAQYNYRCPKCLAVVEPAWLPASSAIDWSIAGTRIGDRGKPLSPKTMTRIQRGIERYWKPITVAAAGNTYDGVNTGSNYLRAWPVSDALPTQTTSTQHGVALPPLITDGIRGEGTVQSGAAPMLTQTTAQTKGLLIPMEGREGKVAAPVEDPMRTQSTRQELAIVVPLRNHGVAKPTSSPIDTVSANGNHHALLMRTLTTAGHQSLLVPYYGASETAKPTLEPHGTLTTTDRYGLVDAGATVDVEDCIFRMLTPDEIKVGMAFPRDYLLLGTKREQVKQSGNAVTPPAARDLGMAVAEYLLNAEMLVVA